MLKRQELVEAVECGLVGNPGVVLLGPRQCGKTTLARQIAAGQGAAFFDLENPDDAAALEQPMMVLAPLRGLVVLDEVQRRPEIFECLRVLMDRADQPAKFLLLGSASPHLVRGVTESLAGRVAPAPNFSPEARSLLQHLRRGSGPCPKPFAGDVIPAPNCVPGA